MGPPIQKNDTEDLSGFGAVFQPWKIGQMAEHRIVYRTVMADDSEEIRGW